MQLHEHGVTTAHSSIDHHERQVAPGCPCDHDVEELLAVEVAELPGPRCPTRTSPSGTASHPTRSPQPPRRPDRAAASGAASATATAVASAPTAPGPTPSVRRCRLGTHDGRRSSGPGSPANRRRHRRGLGRPDERRGRGARARRPRSARIVVHDSARWPAGRPLGPRSRGDFVRTDTGLAHAHEPCSARGGWPPRSARACRAARPSSRTSAGGIDPGGEDRRRGRPPPGGCRIEGHDVAAPGSLGAAEDLDHDRGIVRGVTADEVLGARRGRSRKSAGSTTRAADLAVAQLVTVDDAVVVSSSSPSWP